MSSPSTSPMAISFSAMTQHFTWSCLAFPYSTPAYPLKICVAVHPMWMLPCVRFVVYLRSCVHTPKKMTKVVGKHAVQRHVRRYCIHFGRNIQPPLPLRYARRRAPPFGPCVCTRTRTAARTPTTYDINRGFGATWHENGRRSPVWQRWCPWRSHLWCRGRVLP